MGIMMYYILTLEMPFDITKADKRLMKSCHPRLHDIYRLNFPAVVSCPDAQDLLQRLLRVEPLERYTGFR